MSQELYTNLAIFVLSLLVGFEVISKIPATLHTPMMSGANAIHGVVVVGAILVALEADTPTFLVVTWLPTGCLKCSRSLRTRVTKEATSDVWVNDACFSVLFN